MRKSVEFLQPGKYKLRKPLWKFDSLVMDEGVLLGEKEIEQLKSWNFDRVDVDKLDSDIKKTRTSEEIVSALFTSDPNVPNEPFVEILGVTDVVDEEVLNSLKSIDVISMSTLEELEKTDFVIDPTKCKTPPNLYLEGAITLPDDYSATDVVASTTETVKFLKESFHKLANNQEIDLHKLKLLVTLKIDEMEKFSQTLLNNIFAAEDYDFLHRHSVNVMVLALAIARKLEFKKNWQAEISIAALLHDVGMAKISRDYYINSKKFQFEEYFEIFKHPILGIDYLTLGLQSRFGGLISLAVYQHHERLDGSGYPKGRKGKGISEYARIIGICDVFDAMTSDRPWRKKNSPMEAFRFLADNAEILFDRKIVDLLGEILIEQGMLREDQLSCTGQNTNPIVIADTSPYNLWYVCQLLRQNRIPVFAASNKEDLINASTRLKPQVILIDASMSDRKGIDLIQLLRNLPTTQAVPMIYCSDSGDKQDVVMAIQLGIKDYLKKPYTFDFVVNRLAKYINN